MSDTYPHNNYTWMTQDGLTCHAAIFEPLPSDKVDGRQNKNSLPIICIPGLTRNGSDFFDIAEILSSRGHRVFALTLRGRGQSERDPNYLNYHPEQYRDDVLTALDTFGIEKATFIGTSLGGIVTMLMAEKAIERIDKAIINDVGPRLAPEGLQRISALLADSAAKSPGNETFNAETNTFDMAVASIKKHNQQAFPEGDDTFWKRFTERTFKKMDNGAWLPDYDSKIALAIAELGPGADLWPGFKALAARPTLLIAGGISDLLTQDIINEMREQNSQLEVAMIPNVGHAPMLTEPEAVSAITDFIER